MDANGNGFQFTAVCGLDGTVRRCTHTDLPAGSAPPAGMPLLKTYWFDHTDTDERELSKAIKDAAAGKQRVRAWLRVGDNNLVRSEVSIESLIGEGGSNELLVRIEPTQRGPKRRMGADELETKPLLAAPPAPAGPDVLSMKLAVPMVRVELAGGSIVGANDALADWFNTTPAALAGQPLTELIRQADRQAVSEALARVSSNRPIDAPIDVTLRHDDTTRAVRLTFARDPAREGHTLVVGRDRSAELAMQEMAERADVLAGHLVHQQKRLRQLESLIAEAPVGLALFGGDEALTANKPFVAHTPNGQRSKLTSLVREVLGNGSGHVHEAVHDGRRLMLFKVEPEPQEPPLAGVISFDDRESHDLRAERDRLQKRLATLLDLPDIGAVLIDSNHGVVSANATLAAWSAKPAEAGQPATRLFAKADQPRVEELLRHAKGGPSSVNATLESSPPRSVTLRTLRLDDGEQLLLLLDRGDFERVERDLVRARQRFSALIAVLDRPAMIIDSRGAVRTSNAAAREWLGVKQSPDGKDAASLNPLLAADRLSAGASARDASGLVIRTQAVGDDRLVLIDDQRELETLRQALRANQNLISLLADRGIGAFGWTPTRGELSIDAAGARVLGHDETPKSLSTLLSTIDRDDRDVFERALYDAMEAEQSPRVDVLVRRAGNLDQRLRILGHVARDSSGGETAHRFDALVFDETANASRDRSLRQAIETLALRSAELDAVLEASLDAIQISTPTDARQSSGAACPPLEAGAAPDRWAAEWIRNDKLKLPSGSAVDADAVPVVVAAAGKPASLDVTAERSDGTKFFLRSSAAPVRIDGRTIGVAHVCADLTELRHAEAELNRLEGRLNERDGEIRGIYLNTGVGIAQLRNDGVIGEVNQQLCTLLGRSRQSLIEKPIWSLVHKDDLDAARQQLTAVVQGELSSCTAEVRLERGDGQTLWTSLTIAPHADAAGKATPVIAIVQDISELHSAREALTAASAQVERLERQIAAAGDSDDGLIWADTDGRVLRMNAAAMKLLGVRDRDLTSLDVDGALKKLKWQDEHGRAATPTLAGVRSDGSMTLEARSANGSRWLALRSPKPDGAAGTLLSIHDVGDVRKLQQKLAAQEQEVAKRSSDIEQQLQVARERESRAIASRSRAARLAALVAATDGAREASPVLTNLFLHWPTLTVSAPGLARSAVDLRAVLRWLANGSARSALTKAAEQQGETKWINGVSVLTSLAVQFLIGEAETAGKPLKSAALEASKDGKEQTLTLGLDAPLDAEAQQVTAALLGAAGAQVDWRDGGRALAAQWPVVQPPERTVEPEPSAQAPSISLDVLLVEDHESTARVLSRLLERSGCRVQRASSLVDAETLLHEKSAVQLIVCDLSLPDGDPIAFLRRSNERRGVRGIALGGEPDTATKAALNAAGVAGQILKPVNLHELENTVRSFATSIRK